MAGLVLTGGYASSPDSAAVSVTGNIELVFLGIPAVSWANGSGEQLLTKWESAGNQRSYLFWKSSDGRMRLFLSESGTAGDINVTGEIIPESAVGVKASAVLDDGSGDADITLYYTETLTPDWQVLSSHTPTGISGLFDSNTPVVVGAGAGGAQPWLGEVKRAQTIDGIDGTLVFDAHPADSSTWNCPTKDSFTEKANGATVTLQGDAELVGDCPTTGNRNRMGGSGAIRRKGGPRHG